MQTNWFTIATILGIFGLISLIAVASIISPEQTLLVATISLAATTTSLAVLSLHLTRR